MKALILSFVGALVVGVSIAGAASVLRQPPAPVAVAVAPKTEIKDSARVIDSADVKGAPTDSAHVMQAGAPSDVKKAAEAPADVAATKPAPLSPMPQAPVATPAPAPAATGVKAAAPVGLPEQRIARVFASMAPKDAAKVLEQMSDPDVATILGNLSEKQIALILARLPAPRVAALSKLGLRPRGA
jgi:hypothetical protein